MSGHPVTGIEMSRESDDADNLLVTSTQRIKVADCGTAKLVELATRSEGRQRKSSRMTDDTMSRFLPYTAPEMLAGEPGDASADMYAFGE